MHTQTHTKSVHWNCYPVGLFVIASQLYMFARDFVRLKKILSFYMLPVFFFCVFWHDFGGPFCQKLFHSCKQIYKVLDKIADFSLEFLGQNMFRFIHLYARNKEPE